jgi:hypothetical protein
MPNTYISADVHHSLAAVARNRLAVTPHDPPVLYRRTIVGSALHLLTIPPWTCLETCCLIVAI